MALINCPSCKNRISDKAKICTHCQFNLNANISADGLSKEQLESKVKLSRMKKQYSLQMQAMASIILFLLGIVLWFFLGEKGLTEVSHFVELGAALFGFIWYIVTRVRLLIFKKEN